MSFEHGVCGSRSLRAKSLLCAVVFLLSAVRGVQADTLRGAESPREALAGTAAIVEGSVRGVGFTFDEIAGPRTVASLIDVATIAGEYGERTLDVTTLGGPVDGRRGLFVPELPRLAEDTRYLVFLNNIDWFWSPIVGDYLFRIERAPNGNDVLIAPSGHAVVSLSADAIELTPEPVVDTELDFSAPGRQPRLLDTAAEQLALAMSKDEFVATVRRLLEGAPLSGRFDPSPDRTRVWNRLPVAEGDASRTVSR